MSTESIISLLVGLVGGGVIGWVTNHYYSIGLKKPSLLINGGGYTSNFAESGYRSVTISVQNQLRHICFTLPQTIILGKPVKTTFGRHLIERDPARQCTARLLGSDGQHICNLWWFDGNKVDFTAEIKSGEAATLMVFVRSNDGCPCYFPYGPTSESNLCPATTLISPFADANKEDFKIEVSYSHGSQKVQCLAKVWKNYDGNSYFETVCDSSKNTSIF